MSNLRFDELGISQEILKATSDMNFTETTKIQSRAIPEILSGRDVVGQASTGTGKTLAFCIPVIEKIDITLKGVQAIVVCPTRELVVQVASEMNKLLKYKKNTSVLPIYGGQAIQKQIIGLKRNPKVIVGTPGRMLDHISRGRLKLGMVKMVVLDEADEMLNMGFITDIKKIIGKTPNDRQTIFFSATMSKDILCLTKKFQNDPLVIEVAKEKRDYNSIEQSFFKVERSKKTSLLSKFLSDHNPRLSIVFCNTRRKVDDVCAALRSRGFLSAAIHGDIRQGKRDSIMKKFRSERVNVLVATDVAARGIDVSNIGVVFNYGIPREVESYVHRIGRTGRAGKKGKAISFVSKSEFGVFRRIINSTSADIKLENIEDSSYLKDDFEQVDKSFKRDKEAKSKVRPTNKHFKKVSSSIKKASKNISSDYFVMVKGLVEENKCLESVSAALLKMLIEGNKKPKQKFSRRNSRRQ